MIRIKCCTGCTWRWHLAVSIHHCPNCGTPLGDPKTTLPRGKRP